MVFKSATITAAAAIFSVLSSTVNAHMMMKSPVPYGKSSLNNSPLAGDGSDFPCKIRPGVYDLEGASNVIAIGEPQTLSFTGSAVHGGGSCQVSLTTDREPTKNSKWMVIKSIEGGCPAAVAGNLPADPNGNGAAAFQYTVPEGIAPGEYTIAWSWINKIGNREFYMNCGPATITAAKKKRYAPAPKIRRQSTFPDMFVANIAGVNTCTTPEGFDYIYPNAGDEVQSAAANAGSYTQLACGAGGNNAAQKPTASAAAASPAVATSSAAANAGSGNGNGNGAGVAESTAPRVVPTGRPGVFASGASSASSPAATAPAVASAPAASQPAASAAPASPAETPAAASSGSSSTGGGATSSAAGTACSNEGAWSCAADGGSFQRCASGQWTVQMQMAAGMKCTPGVSDNITMTPAGSKVKRHLEHIKRSHIFGRSSH